ncbi:MAG: insulinase family protein [Candidatus Omnitrophica bacterium]|nr:insulinase family protein [Candidatus Omnitrophota bacterium]
MIKRVVFDNGLRLVTHPMQSRSSVALGFWFGVGGRYESDAIKGAAHFLEHAAFKGSCTYSGTEIKERIEGIGGALNAFTSEEHTCFYAKIPSQFFAETFDVLADMAFFPTLKTKDFSNEKAVILEEIKMYKDLPQHLVMDTLDEMLWPNHPLGKNIAGTLKSVAGLQPAVLKNFHREHYSGRNAVISVCGQIDPALVERIASKKLGHVPAGVLAEYIKFSRPEARPVCQIRRKTTEQTHLALGMLGYDDWHPDRYGLILLGIILGGNMSSRLFSELREKRGLAYSIGASAKCLLDTGAFIIRAGVDHQKVVPAVTLILKEIANIRKSGVSANELRRAKDYVIGQSRITLEDTMEHMLWLGESIVSKNQLKTLKQVVRDFEKVTLADTQRIAREILHPSRNHLAVVGPVDAAVDKALKELITA